MYLRAILLSLSFWSLDKLYQWSTKFYSNRLFSYSCGIDHNRFFLKYPPQTVVIWYVLISC